MDKVHKSVLIYSIVIFIIWTSINFFSAWWNIEVEKRITVDTVTNIARSSFNKDQAYRKWATSHGGVYVKPTEKTPPSPWMAHLPDRDVVTTSGQKLTLMNPAYMLREMMQDYSALYGVQGHIVGIVYLNENNKADEWEEKAIRSFENGTKEIVEFTNDGGEEYLRLMKPMIMNQKCQKCHGHLGFANGSVRGGVSVSVPMKEYAKNENMSIRNTIITYSLIWLFGTIAIIVISITAIKYFVRRENDLEEIVIAAEVFNNTLDAIMITDVRGTILRINKSFTNLTGYAEDEALGKKPSILKSMHHNDAFYNNLWRQILSKGSIQGEIRNRKKSGELFVCIEGITSIKDEHRNIKYFVATMHDITARKNAEKKIEHMAKYDPLTELPNRILFQDRFLQAINIAKRKKQKIALAFIDLDGFKSVNDTKGHPFGDKLLKKVAKKIKERVRSSDTVARFGGDEFIIIFEDFEKINNILPSCKNILNELTKEIIIDELSVFISASMGISIYPDDGVDFHTLIQHADTAMYKAKDDGKNRFNFYEESMTKKAQERVDIETSIQNALINLEFKAYYQPKIYAIDGKLLGMEALVRWVSPTKGLIMPDNFIPIAEDMHIVDKIDLLMLEQVCEDMHLWKEFGYEDIKVAVNLSGYDVGMENLYEDVLSIVEGHNVNPKNIEFEITETYFVNFTQDNVNTLHKLKEYGFSLSIDDFGTGYSSLANLQKLPIDVLKIDQSFIKEMDSESDNKKIVDAIISLASSLSLKTIAEGVETQYQLDYLKSKGCDYIQGYFEAKPMSKDDFLEYIKTK